MSTSYEFADSTPVTSGNSKKHRRGRGIGNRKNKSGTSSTTASSSSKRSNFRLGGRRGVASLSAQSSSNDKKLSLPGRQQQQNVEEGSSSRSGGASNRDDNSVGAGSLTYSASSSVQSAESSNDSSFADIIKLIDSEGEGASEIKDFIAKQSKAASGSDAGGGNMNVFGQEIQKTSAVAGWIQRVEDRQRQHELEQQRQRQQKKNSSSSSTTGALNFHMDDSKMPTNINADLTDLNYSKDSKDDSSEDDVYGVDFDDENVLETIAGLDEDISRQAQAPFPDQDPFTSNHHQTLSAPSSPGRSQSSGHVTPPPNSRHKRTSTPPGATNISRTNSRHSKSSSDGSWDTPAPSSPPNNNNSPNSKPPHARSAPVSKTRRGNKNGKDEKVVEDLSEAFYAKSWMCGFADAFHFDGFDKFNK